MESEHSTGVGLHDIQCGVLVAVPRGRAQCVDDILVDQIFTA